MTAIGACPSIRSVRDGLQSGAMNARQLLDAQFAQFVHGSAQLGCLVHAASPEVGGPGLLHGVALAHKDVFRLRGRDPGMGLPPGSTVPVAQESIALSRLSAAGASYLGALTLSELCCGATGDNPHHGRPVNPLDPRAMVGGSSSGPAVAVAAGLCAASLGTDTAGSVRIPAATCGLVALKPGHRAISPVGMASLAPSLDTLGILARSPSDAAHVWEALRAAPGCAPAADRSVAIDAALQAPRRWRLGMAFDDSALHPDVAQVLESLRDALPGSWTQARRILPEMSRWAALAQTVLHAESAATHLARLQVQAQRLSGATKAILLPGLAVPATWYAQAMAQRQAEREAFVSAALDEVDFLLTPALPVPVPDWSQVTPGEPEHDPDILLALHHHFSFVNYLGLPAVVVPIGVDRRGRPVCVQAIGRLGDEGHLLALAQHLMPHLMQPADARPQ